MKFIVRNFQLYRPNPLCIAVIWVVMHVSTYLPTSGKEVLHNYLNNGFIEIRWKLNSRGSEFVKF